MFAGDHGVARTGVSAYPPEVTAQMVLNIEAGGAAINVLAEIAGATVRVVDLAVDTDGCPRTAYKVRRSSGNIAVEDALSEDEVSPPSTQAGASPTRRSTRAPICSSPVTWGSETPRRQRR